MFTPFHSISNPTQSQPPVNVQGVRPIDAQVCRTYAPRASTMSEAGHECVYLPNRQGEVGARSILMANNTVQRMSGAIVQNFNHSELRVPQRREFLGPEVFNSGCAALFDYDGRADVGAGESRDMSRQALDMAFASMDQHVGNSFPHQYAGLKCKTVNSASGWMPNA